jgi:hypothetical protein
MSRRRERLLTQLLIAPRNPEADKRRQRFKHGGWTTSVPGAHEITFDALPGSPLPAQLTAMGFSVEKTGESQRILPHAIVQRFETSSTGALIPATEGSTKPVSVVVTNAGVATVAQYDVRMP